MDVSLVIPAYNEAAVLPDTIRAVTARLAELSGSFEVLVVDDGSTDGTARLVRGWGDPRVRLEGYFPNRGKGRAVRTGMLSAKGEFVLCTDADLAYGVDVFAALLDRLRAGGADLAVGSRSLGGAGYGDYPPLRVLASRCFGLLSRAVSGLPYDTQCGIKGYRAAAARAVFSRCSTDGFAFEFEVLMRARELGLRVEQVPVSVARFRDSKVDVARDGVRMFRDVFRIRRAVRKGRTP